MLIQTSFDYAWNILKALQHCFCFPDMFEIPIISSWESGLLCGDEMSGFNELHLQDKYVCLCRQVMAVKYFIFPWINMEILIYPTNMLLGLMFWVYESSKIILNSNLLVNRYNLKTVHQNHEINILQPIN